MLAEILTDFLPGAVERSSKHGSDEKSRMILNHIEAKMEKRVMEKEDVFSMIRFSKYF